MNRKGVVLDEAQDPQVKYKKKKIKNWFFNTW
jgi:hypothetical protein